MPKVAYIEIPPDQSGAYAANFVPLYKTKNSSIRWMGGISSAPKLVKVSQRSLLPQIAELWAGLTSAEKLAWSSAGAQIGMNGWRQFVQDTAYRIQHSIAGLATPSDLHSYKVGEILLTAPATGFSIVQLHPIVHYVMKLVHGTKSQREPVAIQEVLTLPFEFDLSYRSNLTVAGSDPYARAYADVIYSYQGRDLHAQIVFEIPLVSDWARQTGILASTIGVVRWYSLFIELHDCQGTLQFDNLVAKHGGTNFGRDSHCNNIDAGFSNYNYQLAPSWEVVAPVTGASFGSVYPSDGPL